MTEYFILAYAGFSTICPAFLPPSLRHTTKVFCVRLLDPKVLKFSKTDQ